MRIAYIVPYVPNLIRTRPYNLIAHLTSLGHEVVVFTLRATPRELIDSQALRNKCSDIHCHSQPLWRSLLNSLGAIPSTKPLQSVYSWQRGLALQLAQRVSRKEFDLVHVEHLRGSRYGVFLKSKFPALPVVWDSVDCISHLFRQAAGRSRSLFGRFVTRFELRRTEKAEGDLACKFDHVLVTSSADRSAILQCVPAGECPAPISVLPNGVDLDYFQPNPDFPCDGESIVFSGKMSYHANVSMAKYLVTEIMPCIWRTRPDVRLQIVGKDPPSEVKELGRDCRVTVTGTVDDIRPFLWGAAVSVVPLLYGAGIQNKILEAMATATPVVTTSQALSALGAQPERDLLVSDTPGDFAKAILCLMENPDLRYRLAQGGLAYVRTFHDWDCIAAQLVSIYEKTLELNGDSHC